MDDQERNREALIEHIAEQDRIIRRRNEQIARVEARGDELARELAAAVTRADKAEKELAEYRAMHSEQIKTIARLQKAALQEQPLTPSEALIERAERAELQRDRAREDRQELQERLAIQQKMDQQPRPLTADDITDEMVKRAQREQERQCGDWAAPTAMRHILAAALTEPTRPEEKVEGVLRRYWSGDVDGTDLAALIVEEMNR